MASKIPSYRDPPGAAALEELPSPIAKKLRALIRRVRRVQIIRGGFATLAAAALSIVAIMAISASLTILSPVVHAILSGAGVLVVIATAYRCLVIPLRKELSPAQMARVIEARHPEIEERLSTAMELLGSDDPVAIRGSEQLLAKVVDSAIDDAKTMRPEREFTHRNSRRYMIAAAAAAAVLLLAFQLFPSASGRLATRVVAPFSQVGNAFADQLRIVPGNLRLPAGDPVTIKVTVFNPDAGRAEIRRTDGDRQESVEAMTLLRRDPEEGISEFSITFPSVGENFRYRVRCDRAVSAYHDVTAVERPKLTRLEITYNYPPYTKLEPRISNGIDQPISAITGSQIQVIANFDRPLDAAVFKIDGNPLPATEDSSTDRHNPRAIWNFQMAEDTEGYWKIALSDAEGIPSQAEENPIKAIPDRAPVIRLLTRKTEFRVRPDERIPLSYEVAEDFGLTSAALKVGTSGREIEQPLPALTSPNRYRGETILDVSDLASGAVEEQTIEVYLQVDDIRPEPQRTLAGPITITIDAAATSLAEQFVNEQRNSIQSALASAIEKLQEARSISAPIARQLLKPDIIPAETLQHLTNIQTLCGEAESIVRDTASGATAPSSLFRSLSPALIATADDHLVPARQSAEEIPLSDEKVTRVHRAHAIREQLDEGIADLQVALRELKQSTARARLVAEMSALGNRQQQVAEDIAASGDAAEQQRLREQQQALAEAMGNLADESEKSVADHLQDARQNASRLSAAASQLAKEQAELAEMLDQAADPGQRKNTAQLLLQKLETEQRQIGRQLGTIKPSSADAASLASKLESSQQQALAAADALRDQRLGEAAEASAANARRLETIEQEAGQPQGSSGLTHLSGWQQSVAKQVDSLARQQLDEALAERQNFLATRAAELAQNTGRFRDQTASLADPSALEQVHEACQKAREAAQAAREAGAQLGGDSAVGAFDFAHAPDQLPHDQNGNPNAPPAPTQAGVETGEVDATPYPDMAAIEGVRENPFSLGEVTMEAPPPVLEGDRTMSVSGGRTAPGENQSDPAPPAVELASITSGQESIASAAQQPALQAQRNLADVSSSLSNAAGNFAQQANSPGAQSQPQISQVMLEAARKAAQVAAEKNPELAAKIAKTIAESLAPAPAQPLPPPDVKNWQNLRGKVRSGLASKRKSNTPQEYRNLVKNYFKEIARRSNQSVSEQE